MIRGTLPFLCTECGKIFLAPDIEYEATALAWPQRCPKCHSMHTLPLGLTGLANRQVYKKIWKEL